MGFFTKKDVTTEHSQASSVISVGTLMKGDLSCKSMLYVEGGFEGNINCNNIVVVGKSGKIKGLIVAKKVVINGLVEGNIDADGVDILKGAVLIGDIITNDLALENGARFYGKSMFKTTLDVTALENKSESNERKGGSNGDEQAGERGGFDGRGERGEGRGFGKSSESESGFSVKESSGFKDRESGFSVKEAASFYDDFDKPNVKPTAKPEFKKDKDENPNGGFFGSKDGFSGESSGGFNVNVGGFGSSNGGFGGDSSSKNGGFGGTDDSDTVNFTRYSAK